MPVYQLAMLSEQDLNDIIAYLLDVAKK
jgi:hypothetical protein